MQGTSQGSYFVRKTYAMLVKALICTQTNDQSQLFYQHLESPKTQIQSFLRRVQIISYLENCLQVPCYFIINGRDSAAQVICNAFNLTQYQVYQTMLEQSVTRLGLKQSQTLPQLTKLPSDCSNSTEESNQHEHRNISFKWLFSTPMRISRETQYLALAYIDRLPSHFFASQKENYECLAATALLIACKFNEIQTPQVKVLAQRCKCTSQDIIMMEFKILEALNYELALPSTPFTQICWLLKDKYESQLDRCEKLLRIAMQNKELILQENSLLAKAVVLVILPHLMRDKLSKKTLPTVNNIALKVFLCHKQAKQKYESQKKSSKV